MTTIARPQLDIPTWTPPSSIEHHVALLNDAYDAHLMYWRAGDLNNAWQEQRRRDFQMQWFITRQIQLGYDGKKFVVWKEKGEGERDGRNL